MYVMQAPIYGNEPVLLELRARQKLDFLLWILPGAVLVYNMHILYTLWG